MSGTGKATNFKFCTHIVSIDRNKNPLQIFGKVARCVVRTLKTFEGTHILGASRGLLCDSSAVLFSQIPRRVVSMQSKGIRAGGRTPRTPRSGGPHACSGASCCIGEPFWAHQNAKNLLVAGAPPRTPLGELTALPQTRSWWAGGLCMLPPPQEPHLQYCHCACPVCMCTHVYENALLCSLQC